MQNPNDVTSKLYDLVSRPIKGKEITDEEIELISSIVPPKSKILDIGTGTGRHLIPLSDLGYNLTGIDSSYGMLSKLEDKIKSGFKSQIIRGDVLTYNFSNAKFDLIILMWNSFNEIALEDKSAQHLFNVFGNLLNIGGKVLINSDDPETTDMSKIDFSLNYSKDNKDYKIHWKTLHYYPENSLTLSSEEVTQPDGSIIETEIKQRWYKQIDYERLGKDAGYKTERLSIKRNTELYMVFTKIS